MSQLDKMKTETPDQILAAIHAHRPMSRSHLYNILSLLEIKPAGVNQRPQRYPVGTSDKILAHLGFLAVEPDEPVKLPTMRQLRAERDRSVKARGGR